MISNHLLGQWKEDEKAPFSGWDFSRLKDRWEEEMPPWDYIRMAKKLVPSSTALLDMATGGGEIFATLAPFPASTFAIEGHPPNVPIAQKLLSPLGVKVLLVPETKPLPLDNESFDLVLNRHGGTNPPEISRILKKEGRFMTQQVAGDSLSGLMSVFGAKPKWPDHTFANTFVNFQKAGFEILESLEWTGTRHFYDVGAVVYFLKAVPWLVDEFSVDKFLKELEILQGKIEAEGVLRFSESRFQFLAKKK